VWVCNCFGSANLIWIPKFPNSDINIVVSRAEYTKVRGIHQKRPKYGMTNHHGKALVCAYAPGDAVNPKLTVLGHDNGDYTTAIHEISTLTSLGSRATSTVSRAGGLWVK